MSLSLASSIKKAFDSYKEKMGDEIDEDKELEARQVGETVISPDPILNHVRPLGPFMSSLPYPFTLSLHPVLSMSLLPYPSTLSLHSVPPGLHSALSLSLLACHFTLSLHPVPPGLHSALSLSLLGPWHVISPCPSTLSLHSFLSLSLLSCHFILLSMNPGSSGKEEA